MHFQFPSRHIRTRLSHFGTGMNDVVIDNEKITRFDKCILNDILEINYFNYSKVMTLFGFDWIMNWISKSLTRIGHQKFYYMPLTTVPLWTCGAWDVSSQRWQGSLLSSQETLNYNSFCIYSSKKSMFGSTLCTYAYFLMIKLRIVQVFNVVSNDKLYHIFLWLASPN